MLKKKPAIGAKVVTGNPDCCWSGHKQGAQGTVVHTDNLKNWGALVKVRKMEYWHCGKCLSHYHPKK